VVGCEGVVCDGKSGAGVWQQAQVGSICDDALVVVWEV
jgi:hypothetical protein